MKRFTLLVLIMISWVQTYSQDSLASSSQIEKNKEIARNFYRDLWFTNNTHKYKEYVADEYVVHDIWDRKGVTEPAIEQKFIADSFWSNGELGGKIDYQIAEGDLVATRWTGSLKPNSMFGRIMGMNSLAIINVFRMKDGKIVEIWNHRHDIETGMTLRFVFKGLLIGLGIALIPTFFVFRLRRKLKKFNSA